MGGAWGWMGNRFVGQGDEQVTELGGGQAGPGVRG